MKKWLLFPILCLLSATLTYGQPYGMGAVHDPAAYATVPLAAPLAKGDFASMPSRKSLTRYLPKIENQGSYGTCTGWATAYYARTLLEALKTGYSSTAEISEEAFSPIWVYEQIKSPDDVSCSQGSHIGTALETMKVKGVPKHNRVPYACGVDVSFEINRDAKNYRIQDYKRLFSASASTSEKTALMKKAVSESKPVVICFAVPESFFTASSRWQPGGSEDPGQVKGYHAMAIVGYDDNKYGGAFRLVNSWGSNWGNDGFTWATYQDLSTFTMEAYEVADGAPEPEDKTTLSAAITFKDAQGSTMPIVRGANAKGLEIDDTEDSEETLAVYRSKNTYNSGYRFRFYMKNKEPAYVYAVASDLATHKVAQLFPHKEDISAYLNYKDANVPLPSETAFFRMDKVPGKDYLCYLFSTKELDIKELVGRMNRASGTFSERLQSVLGSKLVSTSDVNYTSSGLGFTYTTTSNNHVIVPAFVVFPHK